jgi:acrylyl-CoA reductase (NADPH)
MPTKTFRALLAEGDARSYTTTLKELDLSALPAADVLVQVDYSSLNYKDALAATGRGKIIHNFPMVCGNDLAGRVVESNSPGFRVGDKVVAVGGGLGVEHWGGYSQMARVSASALVHLPVGLTLEHAMAIGTAGFTALLSLMALEHHGILPRGANGKELLVTGAAGGVGSTSVALFSSAGYKVAASTGRPELAAYLRRLGASTIVPRSDLDQKLPPLGSQRWAGGVDTVGGQTLASFLSTTLAGGAIAVTGLVGSAEFSATVFPLILRSVSLLGIGVSLTQEPRRSQVWARLAKEMPLEKLEAMTSIQPLSEIKRLSEQILAGKIRGRVVVDVNK